MAHAHSPYGDGRATNGIVAALERRFLELPQRRLPISAHAAAPIASFRQTFSSGPPHERCHRLFVGGIPATDRVVGVVFLVSGTDDLSLTSVIWCGSSTSACL